MSTTDLKYLTVAMKTGDHQAIAKAMGFTIDCDTAKMLDRMGELERLNDELVKKTRFLMAAIEEHRAQLRTILRTGDVNEWDTDIETLLEKYAD